MGRTERCVAAEGKLVTRGEQVAEACAKAILLGEHAVVYGVPALAVPITARRTCVRVRPGGGDLEVVCTRGHDTGLARRMALRALEAVGADPCGVQVGLDSTIPLGAGLGSSAALAVALTRALAVEPAPGPADVARRANGLERLAHGTPSGIDATTVAHERSVWFQQGVGLRFLTPSVSLRLVVAVLPRVGSTAALVARVRALGEGDPVRLTRFLDRAAELSARAEAWLAPEERPSAPSAVALFALGAILTEAHDALRALGVSTVAQDALCAALTGAGALGAKLSGAGGGGATLALLPADMPPGDEGAVIAAGRASGAVDVFVTEVARGGAVRVGMEARG